MTRPGAAALVAAVAATLLVAGCGGGADEAGPSSSASSAGVSAGGSASSTAGAESSTSSPSASPSATPTSYLPVPAGVTLSDQGADLALGATATVAWQPRQDTVGVLDVRVDQLQQTTIKRSFTGWQIPDATAKATPYFVRATITNRGASDLSGKAVPLYAAAGDTLVESTSFASAFKPCRNGTLPAAFAPGATAEVCLVFFVPEGGRMSGVTFRPTEAFDPITWTGEITRVEKRG